MPHISNFKTGFLRLFPVYILYITFTFIVRFPVLSFSTIDWDETTYIIMGKSILSGLVPFEGHWDTKPVGSYLLYSILIPIFGYSVFCIRMAATLFTALGAFGVYLLTEKRSKILGILFGFLYISLIVRAKDVGLATNTEIFFVPFEILAFYFFLKKHYFKSGLFFGFAFLIKYIMIYDAFILGIALLCKEVWRFFKYKQKPKILFPFLYGFGFLLPFVSVGLFYLFTNRFGLYLDSILLVSSRYGIGFDWRAAFQFFKAFGLFLIPAASLLFIGLVLYPWKKWRYLFVSKKNFLTVLLILSSCYSVTFTGYFFDHYYLQIFPYVLIWTASILHIGILRTNKVWMGKTISVLIIFLLLFINIRAYSESKKFYGNFPDLPRALLQTAKELDNKPFFYVASGHHAVYVLNEQLPPSKYVQSSSYTDPGFREKFKVDLNAEFELLNKEPINFVQWVGDDLLTISGADIKEDYQLHLSDYLKSNRFQLVKEYPFSLKLYYKKTK